jgi:S-adenosyl-L-methionine hydrolase (adenosine-forming)
MRVITLTTDFGTRDGYVGAMKGVLARLIAGPVEARTHIVDIAHDIPRGDLAHAAWVVASACREFPQRSIHVVVVDPGVGGARKGVVVEAGGSTYVGPDNGVFAYLEPRWARAIENPELVAGEVSATFHGRDVFATVAAALAGDVDPTTIGGHVTLEGTLPWGPRPAGEGRVVHVDHFGNLVTDLPAGEAGPAIAIAGRRLALVRTYEDVAPGELLAYVGSARTVEVAVRDGRADRVLSAPRGTPVAPVPEARALR